MDILEIMKRRHSVRSFTDQRIEGSIHEQLVNMIEECNQESGLHIQLCLEEPEAFSSGLAHYGKFINTKNYIALVGPKGYEERCGYYGEKIVLKAQELGLNTCWVALTYSQRKVVCQINKDEKLHIVIAIGYGITQGVYRRSKTYEQVTQGENETVNWFQRGVQAALLAPTAVNQQKFKFQMIGNEVQLKMGLGFNIKIDKGILKYHFEQGAGLENFKWKD